MSRRELKLARKHKDPKTKGATMFNLLPREIREVLDYVQYRLPEGSDRNQFVQAMVTQGDNELAVEWRKSIEVIAVLLVPFADDLIPEGSVGLDWKEELRCKMKELDKAVKAVDKYDKQRRKVEKRIERHRNMH